MELIGSLDLGQVNDPSAFAVLEKDSSAAKAKYNVRYLERYPLGTAYPDIVADAKAKYASPKLAGCILCIDQTGVGRPVVEWFKRAEIDAYIRPVTITAGSQTTQMDDGSLHVPKKDIVGAIQVALQSGRLKVAAGLKERATLEREMKAFKVKITKAGNDTFEAWREGDHDDLLLAVAIGTWMGENVWVGGWDTTPPPGSRSIWASAPPGFFPGPRDEDEDNDGLPSPRQVYGCSDDGDDRIGRW